MEDDDRLLPGEELVPFPGDLMLDIDSLWRALGVEEGENRYFDYMLRTHKMFPSEALELPAIRLKEILAADLQAIRAKVEAVAKPEWDSEARKLYFNGRLCKEMKQPAKNVCILLNVFQEDGWPTRIDNPFPPTGDRPDAKETLSETVRSLNTKLSGIRFRKDGTGDGSFGSRNRPHEAPMTLT